MGESEIVLLREGEKKVPAPARAPCTLVWSAGGGRGGEVCPAIGVGAKLVPCRSSLAFCLLSS